MRMKGRVLKMRQLPLGQVLEERVLVQQLVQ